MNRLLTLLALLTAPLAALAAPAATATLRDGAGQEVGTATFEPGAKGVVVKVTARGLKPGAHGIHLHAVGLCEGPDFKSSGSHFNPAGKKHGLDSPEGAHAGDMPNLVVGQDGAGSATLTLVEVTIAAGPYSLFQKDGTALVIHGEPDDGKTDPGGGSGPRVACGVVRKP